MDMDKAPLNRAHQLERKAEILNRQKKFDECIKCHEEAVELFKECLTISNNKHVLESIRSQKEWNERQIRMLQLKKSYFERVKREKEQSSAESSRHSQNDVVEHLEAKIFKTIETHDSLICYLEHRGTIDGLEKQSQRIIEGSPHLVGSKHPKDDSTVIEELKVLSGQLRESVQGLLIQLDDRNKEIENLKSQIEELQVDRSSNEESSKAPVKATTDSSELTSPYIFSPLSELSPDNNELQSLPPIEPLNLPELDLSKLKEFSVPEISNKLLVRKDK